MGLLVIYDKGFNRLPKEKGVEATTNTQPL